MMATSCRCETGRAGPGNDRPAATCAGNSYSARWRPIAIAGIAGALQVLRAVGAGRYRGELCRPGRAQARILLGHVLDDVKFRLPLRHHPACRLTVLDGARPAYDGDARLGERVEKTRIKARISAARVGVGRHAQAQCARRYRTSPGDVSSPHHRARPAPLSLVYQRSGSAGETHIATVVLPRSDGGRENRSPTQNRRSPSRHLRSALRPAGSCRHRLIRNVAGRRRRGPSPPPGDSFVVHMDRDSLNDFPELGKYDVTVSIRDFEPDRLISWTVLGQIRPQIGHVYGYRLEPDETAKARSSHRSTTGPRSTISGARPTFFR